VNEEDVKKAIQLVILPRATITDQPDQDEQPPPPPPPPPPPSDEQEQEEEEQEEEEQDNEQENEQEDEVHCSEQGHVQHASLKCRFAMISVPRQCKHKGLQRIRTICQI